MATLPEFKWLPNLGATSKHTPLVSTVSFGDGYELRVGQSVNRIKSSWDVEFSRPLQEIVEIKKFLEARGGLESFRWTDPIGESKAYVCREWNGPTQQHKGVYVISCTFEEVFEN